MNMLTQTTQTKPEKLVLTTSRDLMLSELITKLRFNRYDLKFMNNLLVKYIGAKKQVSDGQNELFEKLIRKYRKQIKKLGMSYLDIHKLKWEHGIVSIETLNKKTFFKLVEVDGTVQMHLYFNFNKKLIDEIRNIVHDDAGSHLNKGLTENFGNELKYNFIWHNTTKMWFGNFDIYLFKKLYEWTIKNKILIDPTVTNLINKLEDRGSKDEWTPALEIVNDRLYISHYQESMESFVKDIDFTDISIRNIERLTKLGLRPPAQVGALAEYVYNKSSSHTIADDQSVDILIRYIKESGRKCIFYDTAIAIGVRDSKYFTNIQDKLKAAGVTVITNNLTGDISSLEENGYDTLFVTSTIIDLLRSQQTVGNFAVVVDKVIMLNIADK